MRPRVSECFLWIAITNLPRWAQASSRTLFRKPTKYFQAK